MPRDLRAIRLLAAVSLVIAGGSILVFGIPGAITEPVSALQYRKLGELAPGDPAFPNIESRFPIQKIDRIEVSDETDHYFHMDVAYYRNNQDQPRQSLVFLAEKSIGGAGIASALNLNSLRWKAWLDASRFLTGTPSARRLFITWWDNAQRIELLSGEPSLVELPLAEAFAPGQRAFWRDVSGGFGTRSEPLKRLAAWLLSDADQALRDIEMTLAEERDLYFLVTVDDLARLSEMQALSGKPGPFETRLFRGEENIHALISRVKRWAREKGTGSYLVQHLGGTGIRVWRIGLPEGEKTLLARLLPFTSSLANPLNGLDLIHRSAWSGYLSIYRLRTFTAKKLAPQANTR
ncbi:MAG: hypothetical protein ACU843_06765 [Gammaproteobacteria bacterium]